MPEPAAAGQSPHASTDSTEPGKEKQKVLEAEHAESATSDADTDRVKGATGSDSARSSTSQPRLATSSLRGNASGKQRAR